MHSLVENMKPCKEYEASTNQDDIIIALSIFFIKKRVLDENTKSQAHLEFLLEFSA